MWWLCQIGDGTIKPLFKSLHFKTPSDLLFNISLPNVSKFLLTLVFWGIRNWACPDCLVTLKRFWNFVCNQTWAYMITIETVLLIRPNFCQIFCVKVLKQRFCCIRSSSSWCCAASPDLDFTLKSAIFDVDLSHVFSCLKSNLTMCLKMSFCKKLTLKDKFW